jgi:8-oxo-dGTP diphosphatase
MIDVTCAVIRNEEDLVLVVQRGEKSDHPFKWEFPGGKVNSGESLEDCIIREIREELSMEIVVCRKLPDVEHDYGIKKIKLIPFVCDTLDDIPFLSEHLSYKWLGADDLLHVDFSEADIFVAEEYLRYVNKDKKIIPPQQHGTDLPDEAEIIEMVHRISGTKEADWAAKSLIENPVLLKKFIDFSFSDDQKLAFHSSWIVSKACDISPKIIIPHLERIIEAIPSLKSESAIRSFLRILSLTDPAILNQKHQGVLADTCFRYLNSGLSAIAIKAYSMDILYSLTLIYPELSTELALSVRSITDLDSAGIVSKARSILKKLNK